MIQYFFGSGPTFEFKVQFRMLVDIFTAALGEICPSKLAKRSKFDWSKLDAKRLHLIGFGKAAAGMARGILDSMPRDLGRVSASKNRIKFF